MIPFAQQVERSEQELPLLLAKICHVFCFVVFILAFALVSVNLLLPGHFPRELAIGSEGFLLCFAAATTLCALSRHLPAQNVLLAASVIGLIGAIATYVGLKTSVPFGPFLFSLDMKPRISGLPWFVPIVWVVAVLNSRGVARLGLRPWRKTRNYGWWVIGLTIVLCMMLDLGWEVFIGPINHYVLWSQTKFPLSWHGVPFSNFLGWILTLLLIMAFCTPALINKRHTRSIPDYHPLIVWLLLNLVCLIGAAESHLWSAVAVTAACCVIASVFAIRGARW